MSYKFIDEREPSDEELNQLMTQAIQTVERKKKAALDSFMDSLHEQMQKLKQERKYVAQA
jgi:uncharacterized FlgJ-related protein